MSILFNTLEVRFKVLFLKIDGYEITSIIIFKYIAYNARTTLKMIYRWEKKWKIEMKENRYINRG